MWIYVDNNLVLGANPNNMAGNTGWVECNGEIAEPLFDAYGVPMYACEEGVLRERSKEEREADRPEPEPPSPTDGRIEELENMLSILIQDDEVYGND